MPLGTSDIIKDRTRFVNPFVYKKTNSFFGPEYKKGRKRELSMMMFHKEFNMKRILQYEIYETFYLLMKMNQTNILKAIKHV